MEARDLLVRRLVAIGFEVLPSSANFVFARHPAHEGKDLARALRNEGILVRHFEQPRINQYLRITIGTLADCERLCNTLSELTLKTS